MELGFSWILPSSVILLHDDDGGGNSSSSVFLIKFNQALLSCDSRKYLLSDLDIK